MSAKKVGHSQKTNELEDRIMQRLSMGNRLNTAAGIARQFSAEQGKDLSRHLPIYLSISLSLSLYIYIYIYLYIYIYISAIKRLITSKIKVFAYIMYVCVHTLDAIMYWM